MMRVLRQLNFLAVVFFIAAIPALAQEGDASPAEFSDWLGLPLAEFRDRVWSHRLFRGEVRRPVVPCECREHFKEDRRRSRERAQRPNSKRKRWKQSSRICRTRSCRCAREAKRDADAEALRLRALAREEAAKIEKSALAEIAAAERATRLELKALAARMAVERAEALLRDRIDACRRAKAVSNICGRA